MVEIGLFDLPQSGTPGTSGDDRLYFSSNFLSISQTNSELKEKFQMISLTYFYTKDQFISQTTQFKVHLKLSDLRSSKYVLRLKHVFSYELISDIKTPQKCHYEIN